MQDANDKFELHTITSKSCSSKSSVSMSKIKPANWKKKMKIVRCDL